MTTEAPPAALRVVVILEDGLFLAGSVLDQAFDALGSRIVHVVRHAPARNPDADRLRANLASHLHASEKLALGRVLVLRRLERLAPSGLVPTAHRRLRSIARARRVPVTVLKDLHDPASLAFLSRLEADVFVTALGTIVRPEFLAIPRVACLNKHAALLPRHAGLLPAFQALAAGDEHAGMTVHEMTSEVDRGRILAQRRIDIAGGDTVWWLNRKIYGQLRSALEAACAVLEGRADPPACHAAEGGSYHSVPTDEDWKRFRERGRRFI